MYIQWCVKGIASNTGDPGHPPFNWAMARSLVADKHGLGSNWMRDEGAVTSAEIADVLTLSNLYRHLNDYDAYGGRSPFISLAAGSVERDVLTSTNTIRSAIDTALWFATDGWARAGALFYCWTPVGLNGAVEVASVSEAVRDLLVYRDYLPFQPEGEITAKIGLAANQIQRVEWWNPHRPNGPLHVYDNPDFVQPAALTTLRGLI